MTIHLGTQGWGYKDWVGPFYRAGTGPSGFLKQYASHFDSVELDTTFYATPSISRVRAWWEATPETFQFCAKFPRQITHEMRLVECQEETWAFVEAMQHLEHKLGCLLIQMPPDFTLDELPALERFVASLPGDVRFALELRHKSWLRPETFALLENRGIAWTIVDLVYMPRQVEITANFTYLRWLGDRQQIKRMDEVQIDRREELDAWAETLEVLSKKLQRVYGFANNHYSGHSPADVRYLLEKLRIMPNLPKVSLQQGTLL